MKTAGKTKVLKSRLRAIDSGTIYDVAGKLRNLTRGLDRGEFGQVTDALVVFRNRDGQLDSFHFGTGSVSEVYRMANTAKDRLEV